MRDDRGAVRRVQEDSLRMLLADAAWLLGALDDSLFSADVRKEADSMREKILGLSKRYPSTANEPALHSAGCVLYAMGMADRTIDAALRVAYLLDEHDLIEDLVEIGVWRREHGMPAAVGVTSAVCRDADMQYEGGE